MEQFGLNIINGIIFVFFIYLEGTALYGSSKINRLKRLITVLMCALLFILNVYTFKPMFAVLNIYILIVIFYKVIFQKSFIHTLIGSFAIYFFMTLIDIISCACLHFVNFNQDLFVEKFFLNIITDIVAFSILVLFQKYFKRWVKYINHLVNRDLIIVSLLYFWIVIIFLISSFYNVNQPSFDVEAFIIMIPFIAIPILLNEESKREKLLGEYNNLVEYAACNEQLIEEYRISLQQQREELATISSLLKENKRGAKKHVENLIVARESIISEWLKELKNIPSSNLKGLISYKMLEMKSKAIVPEIAISTSVCDIENFDLKHSEDLYVIVGFLLDKAIEDCLQTKEKMISIQMYQEKGSLHLVIANTFPIGVKQVEGVSNRVVNQLLKENNGYILQTKDFRNFLVQDLAISL